MRKSKVEAIKKMDGMKKVSKRKIKKVEDNKEEKVKEFLSKAQPVILIDKRQIQRELRDWRMKKLKKEIEKLDKLINTHHFSQAQLKPRWENQKDKLIKKLLSEL